MDKIKLTKKEIKRIFAVAQSAIIADSPCPVMQHVRVVVHDDELTATALDGFKAAKLTMKLTESTKQDFEFYLRPFTLPKTLQSIEVEKESLSKVFMTIDCTEGKQRCEVPQPEGESYELDRLMPKVDDDLTITVNAKLLITLLKPFAEGENRFFPVQLQFVRKGKGILNSAPIKLSTCDAAEDQIEAILMPIREPGGKA